MCDGAPDFNEWWLELQAYAQEQYGVKYSEDTKDSFKEYYNDDFSPGDAVEEDMSHGD